nr:WD repeat-containing protein 91 homolog isoform X1 [Tanacetum cinerariifolium]
MTSTSIDLSALSVNQPVSDPQMCLAFDGFDSLLNVTYTRVSLMPPISLLPLFMMCGDLDRLNYCGDHCSTPNKDMVGRIPFVDVWTMIGCWIMVGKINPYLGGEASRSACSHGANKFAPGHWIHENYGNYIHTGGSRGSPGCSSMIGGMVRSIDGSSSEGGDDLNQEDQSAGTDDDLSDGGTANGGIKTWNVDAKRVVCNLSTTNAFP